MSSNDTILTMENITKTFGPVKALTDVNLSVDRGEIHAICGENGAGNRPDERAFGCVPIR